MVSSCSPSLMLMNQMGETESLNSSRAEEMEQRQGEERNSEGAAGNSDQSNNATQSSSTTSADRRCCRICQSETGVLVRPCNCTGTMGDIHESCLSKWVNMSRKKGCEICKTPYEKSGSKFRKISEWDKPEITKSNLLDILILFLIAYLLYYIMLLHYERKFFLKVQLKLTLRPDDYGRLGYLFIFMLLFSMILLEQLMLVAAYFIKQREIQFVNRKTKSVLPAED